jgi:diaminohydroxyphosphoribosylaminopyrimidine deaminase/5-amino-6-(5-phosphoribosylamino)uracil reductase
MSLDGKIATKTGESKWITGELARAYGMKLRKGADAVLVGANTILIDNPGLTFRLGNNSERDTAGKVLRRIVLDSLARTPTKARVFTDSSCALTTLVVTEAAARKRLEQFPPHVQVWVAPARDGWVDLRWVLRKLGAEQVTSLLVEGGGEVHASFLEQRLAHRVAFFYAPLIIGGRNAPKAVGGKGIQKVKDALPLHEVKWRWLGQDLLLAARLG